MGQDDTKDCREAILSTVKGSSESKDEIKVKKLRKMVLLSLQMDENDKSAKKLFKRTVKALEEEGTLELNSEGHVSLNSRKRKKDNDEMKKSHKKKKETSEIDTREQAGDDEENDTRSPEQSDDLTKKNKPCKGNPQGITRLFLGNLPFAVDEASLQSFLPNTVTHIKWITDKETGKFYGSAFIEMDNSLSAAEAVSMAGSQLMGRAVKINFAPARPGDVWPPTNKVITGGKNVTGGQAGGSGIKAMSAKPDLCTKLFMGNCSFDIDDDTIYKFFAAVDAEVKAIRWLHHKDSGDFKGCGYVEFFTTEACEKAAALNGKNLLGRPIRLDWSD